MKCWSLGIWPLNLFRSTNALWPSLFRIACQIFKFWFYELISKLITHNSARNSSGGGIIGKLYWWWYFRIIEVWTIHIPHNISTKCQVSVSLLRVLCIPGPERSPRGRERYRGQCPGRGWSQSCTTQSVMTRMRGPQHVTLGDTCVTGDVTTSREWCGCCAECRIKV